MPILNRDQFIAKIKERIGEGTSDDDIAFVQDMTETFDSMSSAENWKQKYEDNDKAWRQKYRDTFYNGTGSEDKPAEDDDDDKDVPKTFEDLFKIERK